MILEEVGLSGKPESEILPQMSMTVQRDTLAGMLRGHGEDDLAARVDSFSDDQMARIGRLGAYYAWSEDALAFQGSMGGARALALATVDVIERSGRDLHRHHTEAELSWGFTEDPDDTERARDNEIRRHAETQQRP